MLMGMDVAVVPFRGCSFRRVIVLDCTVLPKINRCENDRSSRCMPHARTKSMRYTGCPRLGDSQNPMRSMWARAGSARSVSQSLTVSDAEHKGSIFEIVKTVLLFMRFTALGKKRAFFNSTFFALCTCVNDGEELRYASRCNECYRRMVSQRTKSLKYGRKSSRLSLEAGLACQN